MNLVLGIQPLLKHSTLLKVLFLVHLMRLELELIVRSIKSYSVFTFINVKTIGKLNKCNLHGIRA